MFTGIIETTGTVALIRPVKEGFKLEVKPVKPLAKIRLGESIAVNGVCLTVSAVASGRVVFDVIRQTLRLTNLGRLRAGDEVNLERALKYGDRLSGHYVLGHVEATARVLEVLRSIHETEIRVELPAVISKRVVLRGCIAINGISLTVSRRSPKAFSVHVIPHTWSETNLRCLKNGERVNLEADILLKAGSIPARSGPGQKRIRIPR